MTWQIGLPRRRVSHREQLNMNRKYHLGHLGGWAMKAMGGIWKAQDRQNTGLAEDHVRTRVVPCLHLLFTVPFLQAAPSLGTRP